MFNKKLREELIRLRAENTLLHRRLFRVGDLVYVNDGSRDPLKPVYLRESYNNGRCFHVSERKDGRFHTNDLQAVMTEYLSTDRPDTCKCCDRIFK